MELSDCIFEPTEEDELYVDSFFNFDDDYFEHYDEWCIKNYL